MVAHGTHGVRSHGALRLPLEADGVQHGPCLAKGIVTEGGDDRLREPWRVEPARPREGFAPKEKNYDRLMALRRETQREQDSITLRRRLLSLSDRKPNSRATGYNSLVMHFSIHRIRWVARLVLAALLLAQGIHFAQACVVDADRPAMAFGADHCKAQQQTPISPNACLSQCLQADQSSSAYHADVPAAPNVAALVLPIECIQQPVPGVFTSTRIILDRSPSPAFRFCSLQL